MSNTFYITTPIFYPNAKPHMGHAYVSVLCDVMARYHRLVGDETYFLTGTDENASKVGEAAEAANQTVEEFTDSVVEEFKTFYRKLNASFNHFIRTTDKEDHWPGAIEMWKRLDKAGDIYKDTYEGLYCTGCEAFKTEKELEDGKCPDHDKAPKKVKEENYFFRLSKYADQIKDLIESGEMKVEPESRKKEILAFIESGVEDVSFSRPKELVPWGIPVPGDDSQVMYVWCDALANYITALGFGRKDDELFKRFWPANYNVVGKDILRFHTVIWPGMLLSAKVPPPQGVFVHGMILSGGKKMSKTIGNVLDPNEFVDEYNTDALRYYLIRHVSPIEDGDMTKDKFKEVYNGNLANGIGNLTSRIMKMVVQYEVDLADMMLPSVKNVLEGEDVQEYHDAFASFRPDRAADVVWGLIAFMDSYITDTKPFKTIKEDEAKAHSDILFLVERLWEIAILLQPFMPDTSDAIQEAIEEVKMPESLFERKQ